MLDFLSLSPGSQQVRLSKIEVREYFLVPLLNLGSFSYNHSWQLDLVRRTRTNRTRDSSVSTLHKSSFISFHRMSLLKELSFRGNKLRYYLFCRITRTHTCRLRLSLKSPDSSGVVPGEIPGLLLPKSSNRNSRSVIECKHTRRLKFCDHDKVTDGTIRSSKIFELKGAPCIFILVGGEG